MSIKLKIISLTAISCIILMFLTMANIFYQEKVVSTQVDSALDTLMLNHTNNVVQNVGSQLEALNDVLLSEVNSGLKVSWKVLNQKGRTKLHPLETTTWDAVNQYTKKVTKIQVPKMMVGGDWLGQNSSLKVSSPIVDETKKLVGGTTTIFQRINEQGDMLRVCTNVEKLDKTRAIGTYIPAYNPDGTSNPVVSTLMAGKTFKGRAFVVNAWYLTRYEPIYDDNRRIIGALYFGIMQEKTEALRRGITDTVLGKKGYIYVLDKKGNYIISKEGRRDGESVWDEQDAEGNYYIQDIIDEALALQKGEVSNKKYKFNNSDESDPQMRIVSIAYFEPWDWIIGASAYEDDFKEVKFQVQNSMTTMVLWAIVIGVIVTGIILLVAIIVSEKITSPIRKLTEAAEDISGGNIHRKISITSKDETGTLASAFERMLSSIVIAMNRSRPGT